MCKFEEDRRRKREQDQRYFLVTVIALPADAKYNTLTLDKMSNWSHLQCVSHQCDSIRMGSLRGCFVKWRSYMQTFHRLLIHVPALHWNLRPIRFYVRFQYSTSTFLCLSFCLFWFSDVYCNCKCFIFWEPWHTQPHSVTAMFALHCLRL